MALDATGASPRTRASEEPHLHAGAHSLGSRYRALRATERTLVLDTGADSMDHRGPHSLIDSPSLSLSQCSHSSFWLCLLDCSVGGIH